jgi:hypothetical protein
LKRLAAVAMMDDAIGGTDEIMQQTGPNLLLKVKLKIIKRRD